MKEIIWKGVLFKILSNQKNTLVLYHKTAENQGLLSISQKLFAQKNAFQKVHL